MLQLTLKKQTKKTLTALRATKSLLRRIMADVDTQTPAIHHDIVFHFSFLWVINAGSLSNSD